jgi:hypothetical protein
MVDMEYFCIYTNHLEIFQSMQQNQRKMVWLYMSASKTHQNDISRIFDTIYEDMVEDLTSDNIITLIKIAVCANNFYIIYQMLSDHRIQEILTEEIPSEIFDKVLRVYEPDVIQSFFDFFVSNGLQRLISPGFNSIPKIILKDISTNEKIRLSNMFIQAGFFFDVEECIDLADRNHQLVEFFENHQTE